jgi:large subunit ribosomal protein L23
MSKSLLLKPRVSEKAYGLSVDRNTYIFDVASSLNKHSVANAVAAQYEVEVTSVRLANVPGKSQRTYRGRSKFTKGKRTDIRKAYVTLAEGNKLPLFSAEEEAEAKAPKKEAK